MQGIKEISSEIKEKNACRITELTMGAIENVIADAVLILLADFGYIAPYAIDFVKELVTVITFVFLTTQFAQTRHFKEGYHVYSRP